MKKYITSVATAVLISGVIFYLNAGAFNGPTQSPPTGGGSVGANSAGNISIGTSTPSSSTELFIVGSTTNNTAFGLQVLDSSQKVLLSVRNDGVVSVGTSTISGGSFAGTVSAGNISSGQFGSNTGGGNYSFPAALTATSGTVALATTTVTGNITATSLTVTGVTNALHLGGSGGAVSAYAATSCGAGTAFTGLSATGTPTCTAFGSSNSAGTVTTSTAVTTSNFPFWGTATALAGTSTLSISGTTVTQLNNFLIGGTLNVTSTAVFQAGVTLASTLGVTGATTLATTTAANIIDNGSDATTSASFGNVALVLGKCTSSTVSVPGAPTSSVVMVSPVTFPGQGVLWEGYMASVGTAVINLCVTTGTTPTASKYNVRIIR